MLKGLELDLIVAGIIITIIGAVGWGWHQKNVKIDDLKHTVVTQAIANKTLKDTIEDQATLHKVSEKANVKLNTETVVVENKQDAVITKMKNKVAKIEHAYKDSNKTDAISKEMEDTETSIVMIDSLWEAYCTGDPTSTSCKKPA